MSRLVINMDALQRNLSVINSWMSRHGASWTVVTKVLCGHADSLRASLIHSLPRHKADVRLANILEIERQPDDQHGQQRQRGCAIGKLFGSCP